MYFLSAWSFLSQNRACNWFQASCTIYRKKHLFSLLSLHQPLEIMNIQKWKWFVQFSQRLLLGLLLQGPQNLNEQRWFNIFRESSFVKWFSIDKGLFMLNGKACWDIRVTILIWKGMKARKHFLRVPLNLADQADSEELSSVCSENP